MTARALWLGLRLAVGGGREGLFRLAFMAAGVGIAVALLLLGLTAPQAIGGRYDRVAWQDAAYAALSPDTGDDPVPESAGGALFLAVSDHHDGRPLTRAYLAALGDDPPVPPGLDRAPGPGEVAVSPALRRLLESTPDDELDGRFPGRPVLIIGPAGLAHRDELVGIVGRTPPQLSGVRSVGEVHGFTGVRPTGAAFVAALRLFLLTGALLVLVPILVMVVAVTRVAWRQRERRLAAIRLAGATRAQTALVAAAEGGVAAVAGAGLGWVGYELGRRLLAATVVFQGGPFWAADVAVPAAWLAGLLLGTPALVLLATVVSLRDVQASPLAVRRQGRRGRPPLRSWLLLAVGLGGQLALLPFRDQPAAPDAPGGAGPTPAAVAGALLAVCTVVGFVLVGPWLVAAVGRWAAPRSRGVSGLLAARRMAADSPAAFSSVAAVGLAALALTYLGCTVAIAAPPGSATATAGLGPGSLRPGVVSVSTGGVPAAVVEPLLVPGAVLSDDPAGGAPCAELARVAYGACPDPGPGVPAVGNPGPAVVTVAYLPTDGSRAAEDRVRTRAAALVPNAIVHTARDPGSGTLSGFFRDVDALAAVAALSVLVVGAFGLAASTVGGLLERRRPFALLRAAGVRLAELRRTVLLETAATMTVISAAGVAIGMALAYGSARQGGVAWRWPGPEVYAVLAAGVLAALLFSAGTLPLLGRTTRPDGVRFG